MVGSDDTSYAYLCLITLMAAVGTLVWSLLDIRRKNYEQGYYWLIIALRCYVAMVSFLYGVVKLFALQMPFPSLSQLATPIGDLSPMQLSWFFIGYSHPYEFFSGAAECVAGVLLLYRRTSTLGALVVASVFMNVAMLNLSYNIPGKLFSIHLFIYSTVLLVWDAERLLNFFVFNRAIAPIPIVQLPKKWMQTGRLLLKAVFVIFYIIMPFYTSYLRTLTPVNSVLKKDLLTTLPRACLR